MRWLDRVLGLAALVGLGALLAPWLLDGEGAARYRRLPELPDPVPELPRLDPEPAAAAVDGAGAGGARLPEETLARLRAELEAAVGALDAVVVDGRPEVPEAEEGASGWIVQVGSFASPDNAVRLRGRLWDGGYDAFLRSGDDTVRVAVGPVLDRSRAESLAGELRERYALEGMVRPWGRDLSDRLADGRPDG